MHRVDVERHPDIAIVVASGELDAYVVPDLASAFAEVHGARGVIADLEHVSFMDSSALGHVVRAARELEESGAEFRVVLPGGPARRIFEITGLDRALPIAESRRIALGDLEG
jgi:anti-sigma B factor antagonist